MKIYSERENYRLSETIDKKLIPKNSPVFESLGALDELSSFLGLARAALDLSNYKNIELNELIKKIQLDLVSFSGEIAGGAEFATPQTASLLEGLIDGYSEKLPSFKGFIIPGDSELSARLHIARTAARRAERVIAGYDGATNNAVLWINRLSDLIFVLAGCFN